MVRDVAAFLAEAGGVETPSGGRLSVRGLQALGFGWLGTAGGMESLHYLLERAWEVPGESLSYAFLKGAEVGGGGFGSSCRDGGVKPVYIAYCVIVSKLTFTFPLFIPHAI